MRRNIKSGTIWEDKVGYSRVVAIGPLVEVAGTVAANDEGILYAGDAYAQSKYVLEKIHHYLKEAGASLTDVIRTRMYVKNIKDWEEVTRAHAEFFQEICPVTTLLEVSGFIDPEILVEIEVTAYKG